MNDKEFRIVCETEIRLQHSAKGKGRFRRYFAGSRDAGTRTWCLLRSASRMTLSPRRARGAPRGLLAERTCETSCHRRTVLIPSVKYPSLSPRMTCPRQPLIGNLGTQSDSAQGLPAGLALQSGDVWHLGYN